MLASGFASAARSPPSSRRRSAGKGEGEGPYRELILRGATVVDGTGAPPTARPTS
jgi:imidazolonepropionase